MLNNFLTLDFETYYDKDCNIKKLGVSQYIAHPDFHFLSVAVKTPDMNQARSVGGHDNVCKLVNKLKAKRFALCGHNLYFDAYALRYHFDFTPYRMIDTLCMAQALHAHEGPLDLDTLAKYYLGSGKVEGVLDQWKGVRWEEASQELREDLLYYNDVDVERTEGIALEMLKVFPKFELRVIDLTLRMFVEPEIKIDAELAQEIADKQVELKKQAAIDAGTTQAVLRSNDQFSAYLQELSYEVPTKYSEKQEKLIPAVAQGDLAFQRFYESGDDQLKQIIDARKICKSSIKETRAKALIARSSRPFPVGLMYCSAHTMRWGGTDKVNPQNMPRKGRLRHCLMADKGHTFVIVDASQIEGRDNATFSEQWDLVNAFAEGIDVYCSFASELYGREINKADDWEERFVGKTCILGLGYQMGVPKFKNTLEIGMMGPPLKITDEEAARAVGLYRSKYFKIKSHWGELQQLIPAMLPGGDPVEHRGVWFLPDGRILMPNGLHLHYPGLKYEMDEQFNRPKWSYKPFDKQYRKPVRKNLYGGKLLENLVQCRARIMTTEHMLKISKYYRVVLMAHDEVVLHVPVASADQCLQDCIEIMSIAPKWNENCPLAAEGTISDHYVKD